MTSAVTVAPNLATHPRHRPHRRPDRPTHQRHRLARRTPKSPSPTAPRKSSPATLPRPQTRRPQPHRRTPRRRHPSTSTSAATSATPAPSPAGRSSNSPPTTPTNLGTIRADTVNLVAQKMGSGLALTHQKLDPIHGTPITYQNSPGGLYHVTSRVGTGGRISIFR